MKPELRPGMSMAEYQAVKAVSASMIHALVDDCPLKAWFESPWNPGREQRKADFFDEGTALHFATLEPDLFDQLVVEVPFDEYRTKEAKALRDEAYAAGRTPLKPAQMAMVHAMSLAIKAHPEAQALFDAGGYPECSYFWETEGILCKARADFLSPVVILDPKALASTHPRAVARRAFNDGWHVRSQWYLWGAQEAIGERPWPTRYIYLVVEKEPPHLVQLYEMESRAMDWGRQAIVRGLRLFRDCMERGVWPGYGSGIMPLSLPAWGEHQLAEQEMDAP